jgi:hypothetical protein
MVKLLKVTKLPATSKQKYQAVFKTDSGRTKTTNFGASGYNDYTITGDKEARKRYRDRHRKDLKTNDPTRAGYLAFHILWGDSKSVRKNVADYKKRFNL